MSLRTGLLAVLVFALPLRAEEPKTDLRADATKALKTAATFYRTKVASRCGYVYYYTPDLAERWGEGKATADTIFVQPPGTPTVGSPVSGHLLGGVAHRFGRGLASGQVGATNDADGRKV